LAVRADTQRRVSGSAPGHRCTPRFQRFSAVSRIPAPGIALLFLKGTAPVLRESMTSTALRSPRAQRLKRRIPERSAVRGAKKYGWI